MPCCEVLRKPERRVIKYLFMNKLVLKIILCVFAGIFSANLYAKGTYLEPEKFLNLVFNNNPPKSDTIWIKKELKENIDQILGHDLGKARVRYWDDQTKRAWILEEIGKDKPITVGLVTVNGKIDQVRVLIFRETRGWEVKYPFFTDQFKELELTEEKLLNKKIDGISGATLSVNALTKLARLALYLDSKVGKKD